MASSSPTAPVIPDAVPETYTQVQQLIGRVPVFGICLGHQMISLAAGAQIEKLKFGHRGGNQPVMNLLTRRVEITAQNHGFGLVFPSLGALVPELSGGVAEHPADGDLRFWVERGIAPVVENERFRPYPPHACEPQRRHRRGHPAARCPVFQRAVSPGGLHPPHRRALPVHRVRA